MKKIIAGFLAGVITTIGITAFANEVNNLIAQKATFPIFVNGQEFKSDKPIAVINGSTYLPLKDTGEALGVDVNWNTESKRVDVNNMNVSPTGTVLEVTPTPMMSESTPSNTPTTTPIITSTEEFGSNKKVYTLKSNIKLNTYRNANSEWVITYQGEYYVLASIFNAQKTGDDFYIDLPDKKAIKAETKDFIGRPFVKLSSIGLTIRIEGNIAWIE